MGYLLRDDESGVVVAQSLGATENVASVYHIPRGAIREVLRHRG